MSRKMRPNKAAQKAFSKMLCVLLQDGNLSRLELAQKIGVSKQFLNDIEKTRRLPSLNFVHALTKSLTKTQDTRYSPKEWHAVAARAHGWLL